MSSLLGAGSVCCVCVGAGWALPREHGPDSFFERLCALPCDPRDGPSPRRAVEWEPGRFRRCARHQIAPTHGHDHRLVRKLRMVRMKLVTKNAKILGGILGQGVDQDNEDASPPDMAQE